MVVVNSVPVLFQNQICILNVTSFVVNPSWSTSFINSIFVASNSGLTGSRIRMIESQSSGNSVLPNIRFGFSRLLDQNWTSSFPIVKNNESPASTFVCKGDWTPFNLRGSRFLQKIKLICWTSVLVYSEFGQNRFFNRSMHWQQQQQQQQQEQQHIWTFLTVTFQQPIVKRCDNNTTEHTHTHSCMSVVHTRAHPHWSYNRQIPLTHSHTNTLFLSLFSFLLSPQLE